MGKKKKKKKKGKKRSLLGTLAHAVTNPVDATKNLSHEGKLAGGIDLVQLVTAIAALFKASDDDDDGGESGGKKDGDGSDGAGRELRENVKDLVDARLMRVFESDRFEGYVSDALRRSEDGLREEVRELAERLDELERRVARRPRRAKPRTARKSVDARPEAAEPDEDE